MLLHLDQNIQLFAPTSPIAKLNISLYYLSSWSCDSANCMVVLPDPLPNSVAIPKVWTRDQKWKSRAREAQMRNNPEGGELDLANDVRRCWNFRFILHR